MKRILIIMSLPPGATGVQGLRYSKLFPFTIGSNWEIHFAGPAPEIASVSLEPLVCPSSQCHYSRSISWSIRFSILKHRHRKGSAAFISFGILQLIALLLEKGTGHDSFLYMRSGLLDKCRKADDQLDFDLVAAKTPDFRVLELGAQLAQERSKPFLALYDDPHGQRDSAGFYPDDVQRQYNLLQQAAAVIFMSPMTRRRYIELALVQESKTFEMTDSYPAEASYYKLPTSLRIPDSHSDGRLRVVHLGNLPEWRPLDPLVNAILRPGNDLLWTKLSFCVYGFVYPAARDLIDANPRLSSIFSFHSLVSHAESHEVAQAADVLLVMIGARHVDNQPSKFFVYLGHSVPVLVIGPPGNPVEQLIHELEIGVFCDVNSEVSIQEGLLMMLEKYDYFKSSFERNHQAIEKYRADSVATRFLAILDRVDVMATSP